MSEILTDSPLWRCSHRNISETVLLDDEPEHLYYCRDCGAELEIDPEQFAEYQAGERDTLDVKEL